MKNEEIYNIFDTNKFLNRPVLCAVSNTSGLAGIAHWINTYFHLPQEKLLDKNSELVHMVKAWVDKEYEDGRLTILSNQELEEKIAELQAFISRFSANKSKSRQATSRRKLLDKLTVEELPASSRRYPFIGFDMDREAGKEILHVEGLSKSLDGKLFDIIVTNKRRFYKSKTASF